jgi:hypothetical protein
MTQQHPITPPAELVEQWWLALPIQIKESDPWPALLLATRAAQWGADQELEVCCEQIDEWGWEGWAEKLRSVRRSKPPSLKRVALLQLDTLNADLGLEGKGVDLSQIRRALEQLPDDN